jgi:hypothetical protein
MVKHAYTRTMNASTVESFNSLFLFRHNGSILYSHMFDTYLEFVSILLPLVSFVEIEGFLVEM